MCNGPPPWRKVGCVLGPTCSRVNERPGPEGGGEGRAVAAGLLAGPACQGLGAPVGNCHTLGDAARPWNRKAGARWLSLPHRWQLQAPPKRVASWMVQEGKPP